MNIKIFYHTKVTYYYYESHFYVFIKFLQPQKKNIEKKKMKHKDLQNKNKEKIKKEKR